VLSGVDAVNEIKSVQSAWKVRHVKRIPRDVGQRGYVVRIGANAGQIFAHGCHPLTFAFECITQGVMRLGQLRVECQGLPRSLLGAVEPRSVVGKVPPEARYIGFGESGEGAREVRIEAD